MNGEDLHRLLDHVRQGTVSVDEAARRLKLWPLLETDSALIDTQRRARRGLPEVIYCEGKTPRQVQEIFSALAEQKESVLGTRASSDHRDAVAAALPDVDYDPIGRLLMWSPQQVERATLTETETNKPKQRAIAVVSAGASDEPILREVTGILKAFGHPVYEVRDAGVAALHRIVPHIESLNQAAAVIVVAGMDGALPSVVGGLVESPVIAVPTSVGYGASFGGLSALLAMLNSCAGGVTVVNIDNGFGAAYAASLIARKVDTSWPDRA